jgi:hypothetical protein
MLTENQKGGAVIEVAIVLPVFIFLFVAIVDFGLYFNKRNVAQSAVYNAAKECPAPFSKSSIGGLTLETMDLFDSVNMTPAPSCADHGDYYKVDIRIKGTMMSPFTSALGLYDDELGFLVTGIASK